MALGVRPSVWSIFFGISVLMNFFFMEHHLMSQEPVPAPPPPPTTVAPSPAPCPSPPATPPPTACPSCPPGRRVCGDWIQATRFLEASKKPNAKTDKTSNFGRHAYELFYEKNLALVNGCTDRKNNNENPKIFEVGIGPLGRMRSWGTYQNYFGGREHVDYYALEYQNQTLNILEVLTKEESDMMLGTLVSERAEGAPELKSPPGKHRPTMMREGGRLFIGDQSKKRHLHTVMDLWGPFDYIIDDGSHRTEHQLITFQAMFVKGVKPGGVYIVEDLHTNFHPSWAGSIARQQRGETMISLLLDMIKLLSFNWWLHPDYVAGRTEPVPAGGGWIRNANNSDDNKYGQELPTQGNNRLFYVPLDIMDWVQTIDCDREICAIRKRLTKLVHRHPGPM